MAEVKRTRFQFRRGNEDAWKRNNPTLANGEPGHVSDKNKFKIGDGITPWNLLKYPFESVYSSETRNQFPSVGEANILYKTEKEKSLYQWNQSKLEYEKLGISVELDAENETLIVSTK